MIQRAVGLVTLIMLAFAMAACSADNFPTPTSGAGAGVTSTVIGGGATMTAQPQSYPKMGTAPDYSWIAGQVAFTRIQGGCVYIQTGATPAGAGDAAPTPAGPGAVVVGTSVANDTSPPLRDITPVAPSTAATQTSGSRFVPTGPGWDSSKVKNGDYVVAFGHVAGAGEPSVMCPGGTTYIVDSVQLHP
ncbi:MAG: hypothetical protein IVW55_10985 [Chloroflexi bacterium]|nr:hypothetical protein [Chloroflexota bacterium]